LHAPSTCCREASVRPEATPPASGQSPRSSGPGLRLAHVGEPSRRMALSRRARRGGRSAAPGFVSAELPTSLIPRNARLSPSLGHCNIFGRISWFIVGDGGIKADGHEVMFAVSAHGQDQESSRGDKHCRAAPAECSQGHWLRDARPVRTPSQPRLGCLEAGPPLLAKSTRRPQDGVAEWTCVSHRLQVCRRFRFGRADGCPRLSGPQA